MSRRIKTLISTENDRNRQTASTSNATTIPYLPDNVIEKILSFLPINLAGQANTVSKQWAALWPSFPVIDLDEADPINCELYIEPGRFLSFLHHSVRRCGDQRLLDKLRIRANLRYAYVLVTEWIDFAIDRCVKELDLRNLGENCEFLIAHAVLTLKSLTSLNLENVRVYASSGLNGPVCLPLLKTMSLTELEFFDDEEDWAICAVPSLISGCPSMEQLSIKKCKLGYSTMDLEISSYSLKSLEIMHCHCMHLVVTAQNLESFTFYSDCTCPYHKTMYLWECDNLKHVDISCEGLKQLLLHTCLETMENSFHTPNLESFEFSGYLKAKVHFVDAPSKLLKATIRVWETSWPIEYYSAMRDFLESFNCSKKVKLHIEDAEGVIIPEHRRMEWSSPLPSIKQLQLYFYAPLGDREYCLRPSLIWMAPSAEILPFLDNNDYDYDDDDEDEDDDDYDDDDDDDDDDNDDVDDHNED
ncbi:putative F-box domain, leucine-rich repeat domain, L domain-containing protein [Rosa chinensis]|uniref:Putative F-box domain, leucine-rich repeat domain, L domain-containing protein n=1 Tax=Rosa chinensis TaxID=74649 RepID=A0A2P6PMC9_ROSCH|nr:F-box/FBD/LRR-repeat protein At4g26340 [Rosa chinensis]PRQ23088.1 putative F-box domain, leucine-rich repeat domain, L domain-containing protein [Rosa chinensis]